MKSNKHKTLLGKTKEKLKSKPKLSVSVFSGIPVSRKFFPWSFSEKKGQ